MNNKLLVLVSVLDALNVVVATTTVKNSPGLSTIVPVTEGSNQLPLFLTASSPCEVTEHIASELDAQVSTVPELRVWVNTQLPDMAFAEEYSVVVEAHRFDIGLGVAGSVRKLRCVNTEDGVRLLEENKLNLLPDRNNKVAGYNLAVPSRPGLKYLYTQINEATGYVEHNYRDSKGAPIRIFCTREGNAFAANV